MTNKHKQELQDMIDRVTTYSEIFFDDMEESYPEKHLHEHHTTMMKADMYHAFQEGDYADAFAMAEEYTQYMEDVEIAYTNWEKEHAASDINQDMQGFLTMVHTAPHEIIIEQKKELDHLEDFFGGFDTHDDHMMSWLVYKTLQWVEAVVLLVLIRMFLGMLIDIFPQDEKHFLLMTFVAMLGICIYLLRKTRYKRGLLTIIVLCVVVYVYLVPRLT